MRVRWFRRPSVETPRLSTDRDERSDTGAPSPGARALGEPYVAPSGLRLTVTALHDDGRELSGGGTGLTLLARVENPSADPLEFDNIFGIMDGSGVAHPRGYADPAVVPTPLPPSATIAAGEAVEGAVYVHVAQGAPQPFRSAYLAAAVRGCSSCPGGATVDLVPLAVWQPAPP